MLRVGRLSFEPHALSEMLVIGKNEIRENLSSNKPLTHCINTKHVHKSQTATAAAIHRYMVFTTNDSTHGCIHNTTALAVIIITTAYAVIIITTAYAVITITTAYAVNDSLRCKRQLSLAITAAVSKIHHRTVITHTYRALHIV